MSITPMNLQLFKKKVDNFEVSDNWKFEGDKPAVIEFFATWCPHCKRMAPLVEELAEEYDSKVDFYTVDIDKEPQLAELFGVNGTPTFIFISRDGEISEAVGEHSEEFMEEQINQLL